MAEAEDVIVDAARHATEYLQNVWSRRRGGARAAEPSLAEHAPRLSLLLAALHARDWSLRAAQAPAPATALSRVFSRANRPWATLAVPSSARHTLWLPARLPGVRGEHAAEIYRAMALQQAARARLRPADLRERLRSALSQEMYLVLEAEAADAALARSLPGLVSVLSTLRDEARLRRPPLSEFAKRRLPLELWYSGRARLGEPPLPFELDALVAAARKLAEQYPEAAAAVPLFKDWWTGDWPSRESFASTLFRGGAATGAAPNAKSARLERRPKVREADPGEDDAEPGAFMIQTAQPHEHAEDPMGAQRPTDRDADSAAEGHAESVAELVEARLVRSPEPAHEVLLSDDAPPGSPQPRQARVDAAAGTVRYPEWDYRQNAYRDAAVTVFRSLAEPGPEAWVLRTLLAQRATHLHVRRQFEMLRARRVTLHRQEDGDELDIDACVEAWSDLRGGAAMPQRLYQRSGVARRDTAVLVLIDVSGSTDGWLAGDRRIIDVEREALLALSIALDGLGEPYAIVAFSGEGPHQVVARDVKRFDERHSHAVALRIAGLEPERYTRAGAALRHAAQMLVKQPARHRLLLLLSDGKPNDCDEYEGRYGAEDTRQAVLETRQAGLSTFCLTVDRQAAAYLPRIFGPHHYALLQHPERLPVVLLDWMRRLLR
jgi:nitric oxide reductase NorD protein